MLLVTFHNLEIRNVYRGFFFDNTALRMVLALAKVLLHIVEPFDNGAVLFRENLKHLAGFLPVRVLSGDRHDDIAPTDMTLLTLDALVFH